LAPTAFWNENRHKWPVLAKAARITMGVSIHSCTSERSFSSAKSCFIAHGANLAGRNAEMCVTAHAWLDVNMKRNGKYSFIYMSAETDQWIRRRAASLLESKMTEDEAIESAEMDREMACANEKQGV
jgi:hypothetical protein